jgi:hypothetical protein
MLLVNENRNAPLVLVDPVIVAGTGTGTLMFRTPLVL